MVEGSADAETVVCTAIQVGTETYGVSGRPDDWIAELNAWPGRFLRIAGGYIAVDHIRAVRPYKTTVADAAELATVSDVFEAAS